jgi:hypothetical protein
MARRGLTARMEWNSVGCFPLIAVMLDAGRFVASESHFGSLCLAGSRPVLSGPTKRRRRVAMEVESDGVLAALVRSAAVG